MSNFFNWGEGVNCIVWCMCVVVCYMFMFMCVHRHVEAWGWHLECFSISHCLINQGRDPTWVQSSLAKPAAEIPVHLPSWITSGRQTHWACRGNPNICLPSCTATVVHWIRSPSKTSVFATFYCFSSHTALATTSKEEMVKTEPGVVPDLWGSISSLTIISDVKQTWVSAFVRMKKLSPTHKSSEIPAC